jgi:hypothetical protein
MLGLVVGALLKCKIKKKFSRNIFIRKIMLQWNWLWYIFCIQMIWYCWLMVFNATFINISVTSWRSVLLVEETGVPREYMIFSSTFIVIYEDILVGERYWYLSLFCSIYFLYFKKLYDGHLEVHLRIGSALCQRSQWI